MLDLTPSLKGAVVYMGIVLLLLNFEVVPLLFSHVGFDPLFKGGCGLHGYSPVAS